MTTPTPADPDTPEEIVPDYSRSTFRELQALCKVRGITADGRAPQLIDKLKAWDAEHGRDVDTTLPEGTDDEPDLLALDDDVDTPEPAPQTSTGAGEAASAPAPVDPSPASPAVEVKADTQSNKLPIAQARQGRPNLAARDGLVRVGDGRMGDVRAYRKEFVVGDREITDTDHFRFIEQTHAAAAAEGLTTKGGVTIGERVGFAANGRGERTAIYQVPLRRA